MKPEFRLVSKLIPRASAAMETIINAFDVKMHNAIDEIAMHGGSYAVRKPLLVSFINQFRLESGALVVNAVRSNNKKSAFELSLRALENELALRIWSLDHDGAHSYDNLRDRQQVLSNYYEGFLQNCLLPTNSSLVNSVRFGDGVSVDSSYIPHPKACCLAFNARYEGLDLGWMAISRNPTSGLFRLFIFQTQKQCLEQLNICDNFVGAAMLYSFFSCNKNSALPEYLPVSCIAHCDNEFEALLKASNQEEKYRADFFCSSPQKGKGVALKAVLKTEMLYDLSNSVLKRSPSTTAKFPVCNLAALGNIKIIPQL